MHVCFAEEGTREEGETNNCEMMTETAKLKEEGRQKNSCRLDTMSVLPQTVQVERPHRDSTLNQMLRLKKRQRMWC